MSKPERLTLLGAFSLLGAAFGLGAAILLRAAFGLRAAILLRAGAILIRAGSAGGAAVFLIAALLLGAALGLRAFCLLSAALLHTGNRGSRSRSGLLGLGHAEREHNGKQSKSEFLHDNGSFYGLGF